MELGELVGRRPFPAAGLLLGLTRRCPLSCAHCSTGSDPTVREAPDAGRLVRFVGSFTSENRPDVVMLTGGEPLLLPGLVEELSALARRAGSRTALLSGMFFARSRHIPAPILRAITGVDHFSASLDVHHEREVGRADVFRALHRIREAGVAVSFHLTGTGASDPYLADLTRDVEEEFGGQVPSLVNEVRPFGRAASWAGPARGTPDAGAASPCSMAAWPVVAFDGAVLACCNQDTVDLRPAPAHLYLGHIATDDWAAVRRRALESPVLRMIRTVGPAHLADRSGVPPRGGTYCDGCRALGGDARVAATAGAVAAGAAGALLDLAAARRGAAQGPEGVVRRHGCAAYAPLVVAGAPGAGAVGGSR
ncbi:MULTISPECIES: radical SAM protein [unclassified Streptomyces]|uniref:radical SAM protein n=1 Tax=unclassified Streptomyces TaxID=2593676 RepID=UPI0001C1CFC2|nr:MULTISPECIES: radical SAM protein [unclassified Streptomyces]AEN10118.1 Radical SAM domain protein [Streptomyces sp. SirexAA-E]MYT66099.1 radical SAM protein [Streptomyces sp. SID8357]MYT88161.1 radical SAM protein [Streptomyces sp. SID8360]MYW37594.1 radical SAM protein [Streptomyces sp. SID1]PZX31771.1 radical SAM family protein [Streptomyces sp. DvalAA-21]